MKQNARGSNRFPSRTIVVGLLVLSFAGCSRIKVQHEMHEANSDYKAQHYEDAVGHYKTVVAIDPSYKDAWLNMGYAYRALFHPGSTHPKDVEYANDGIAAFKKFLELEPDSATGRDFFLEFCQAAERHDDAIAYFQDELKRKPDPQVIKTIATLYGKKGDVEKTLTWLGKWTDAEPQNPEAWYTIGVTCWERSYKDKFMEAGQRRTIITQGIQSLGKALEIKPDYFEALSYMNLIYREKAKLEAESQNAAQAGEDQATAESYMKKAMEVRNAQLKAQQAQAK
jgi:tetratricopeptide (TPR) repeat protein